MSVMAPQTITNLDAKGVYDELDSSHETLTAMVRAEKFGAAMAHGARITHSGYVDGAREFNAATATYRVTYN